VRLEHDWYDGPLPDNVSLGERSWLWSAFAFIHSRARRRDAVRIGSDTGMYFGTNFALGPDAQVTIGDFTTIGGAVLCTNGRVTVGDHALLSYSVIVGGGPCTAPGDEGDGDVVIGDDVWVGAGAVLLPGAVLGDGVIVGARTVVDFEVPAGCVVAGSPARVVKRPQAAPA
jgi:acetyltransferase-like isoleucine patch superfamily enzyme